MYNSTGYIGIWLPRFQTGMIFGCDGGADGLTIAFKWTSINDESLKQKLASASAFELERDPDLLPPGALSVNFYYDGNGFAQNILPR